MPLLCTDLDDRNYVSFVSHDRTRLSNSFNLRNPFCKTSTFQASYFNRTVKLWNYVCRQAPPTSSSSLTAFQLFVRKLMSTHLSRVYEINYPCTWIIFCTNVWVFILFYFNLGLNLGVVPRMGRQSLDHFRQKVRELAFLKSRAVWYFKT